ncbi:unnamed protein product [Rhizoctonia solani]|uniref:Uncharacterized protein n=1 Tax=Rhizoctonia solani TaxID=456999 RepID=A0A8H3AV66_9AGAM|nr:unnamed protein product [Rhizoctonia solani]
MDTPVDSSHLGPVSQGIQHALGYASNSSNNESTWRGVWSTTFTIFHFLSFRLGAALECQIIPEYLILHRGGASNPLAPLDRTMAFPTSRPVFRSDSEDNSQHHLIEQPIVRAHHGMGYGIGITHLDQLYLLNTY